jgi:hypothetical protein
MNNLALRVMMSPSVEVILEEEAVTLFRSM